MCHIILALRHDSSTKENLNSSQNMLAAKKIVTSLSSKEFRHLCLFHHSAAGYTG